MASNGVAGEFYVAAQLSKLGMVATITGKNTKDIDIIAANPETGKTLLIQVKEKSLANKSCEWKMSGTVKQTQIDIGVWYVFVDLATFECHCISAAELFPKLKKRQDDYNNGVGRYGQKRAPDPCFYFNSQKDILDENGKVKVNNWEDLPLF